MIKELLIFSLLCISFECYNQEKIYPLNTDNISTDSLLICLTDIDNFIVEDFHENENVEFVLIDSFELKIITNKELISKYRNDIYINKTTDCSYISTPGFHFYIFRNGSIIKHFDYCLESDLNLGRLSKGFRNAILKSFVYSNFNNFEDKIGELRTDKQIIILNYKSNKNNNRYLIWIIEFKS